MRANMEAIGQVTFSMSKKWSGEDTSNTAAEHYPNAPCMEYLPTFTINSKAKM